MVEISPVWSEGRHMLSLLVLDSGEIPYRFAASIHT